MNDVKHEEKEGTQNKGTEGQESKAGKKRGAERTQIATRNEEWSDERLKSFLELQPPEGMPQDYCILLKAYRGMTEELFARFIPFFVEDGRDLNVTLEDGSSFLDLVSRHRKSTRYAEILAAAGARRSKTSTPQNYSPEPLPEPSPDSD